MRVTCTIILNILRTVQNNIHITHITIHIMHNVVHIIYSYDMRPWNHGHDIKTSQNEGSTYETSTKKSVLASIEFALFIHMYFISFHSWASVNTRYTQNVVQDFHRVCCVMTKNALMSLPQFNSPLDYHMLKPLVSLVALCASFEADLIHTFGTLTLTDIDHVSIMTSSVMKPHTKKRQNHLPK